MVRLMYQLKKCVEIKGDYVEKQQSCFICHLKKLVRTETFGPYYVYIAVVFKLCNICGALVSNS